MIQRGNLNLNKLPGFYILLSTLYLIMNKIIYEHIKNNKTKKYLYIHVYFIEIHITLRTFVQLLQSKKKFIP